MSLRRLAPLLVAVAAVVVIGAALAGRAATRSDVGVVVDVESSSLTDVQGFTLRGSDGRETRYRIGRLENGDAFPPGHLVEHQATSEPVRVVWREDGTGRVAVRLEDGSGG